MPHVDMDTLAVCIQALEKALKFIEHFESSETVNSRHKAESRMMYEGTLDKICHLYKDEERKGNASIPLNKLVKRKLRRR